MSSEAIAQPITVPDAPAPLSAPLRNLLLTFALTIATLAVSGYFWGSVGYQILIVAMGWPHIVLGFLFYFGKVLRGEWRARQTFAVLALLTLALWVAHYTFTITGFIAVYFTYHVFRDEVFIYFQTRAHHKLRDPVALAGFVPLILLMFLVTDPRPQHYRQDLRRVELTSAQFSNDGWTLIPFEPIEYSEGKTFYFFLDTPSTADASFYTTLATRADSHTPGEIRISDRPWTQAADLVFQPYYAGEARAAPARPGADELAVALKGGHRVGQTFTAAQNHLAGIWIPTKLASGDNPATSFHFHLTPDASIPWPHLSPPLKVVRAVLIVVLLAIFLWLAAPYFKQNRAFWFYFAILVGVFVAIQKLIRSGGGTGLDMPVMFQAVVVFHYWSWYVFSFDKLRALTRGRPELQTTNASHLSVRGKEEGLYDKLMANLRSLPRFTALVIILNLLSAAGVVWFAKLHGPGFLRYIFDYSYFLYFLVFHVTFSFAPRQAPRPKPVGFRLQEPAKQVKA